MLWRRCDAQAQASGQAEGRQKEDAPIRQGGDPAGGLHRRAQNGRGLATIRRMLRRRFAGSLARWILSPRRHALLALRACLSVSYRDWRFILFISPMMSARGRQRTV